MHTYTTIDLIYGFWLMDENGDAIEGDWDQKPSKKKMDVAGITLIFLGPNYIPVLGISDSHRSQRPEFNMNLGQNLRSKSEWKEILKDFCSKNNIYFKKPTWHVIECHHSVRRHYDDDYED